MASHSNYDIFSVPRRGQGRRSPPPSLRGSGAQTWPRSRSSSRVGFFFFGFFFPRRSQFPFRWAFAAAALSEHALYYPFSGSYIRGDLDPGWIICPPVGVRQGAAGRPGASLECLRQSGQKKFRLNLEKTEIHPTHYFDAFTGSFFFFL